MRVHEAARAINRAEAVGIVKVARQISAFVGRFMDSFFHAIYPELALLKAKRKRLNFAKLIKQASLLVGAVSLVILAVASLIGQPIITAIFGTSYDTVYELMLILLFGMSVWGFAQPIAPGLMALGEVGAMLMNHFVAAAIYLLALWTLVPEIGMVGAALSFVIFQALWALISWFTLRRKLKLWT